jgi:polyhydroxybutyrate depolymerase
MIRVRRWIDLLGAVAQVSLLSACTSDAVFVEPHTTRRYRVLMRWDHDRFRPAPVLFALHAYSTDPAVLVKAFALDRRATTRRGWIVVVPEGARDADGQLSWNASAACCGTGDQRPDDVDYLHRVLEEVRKSAAVEPERVYAIGESNGAFMAHRWACAAWGDLRAIVSISGAAMGPDDPPCSPAVPVSVLHIHGDRDEMIRYDGGKSGAARYRSARESVELWRSLDHCSPEARLSRGGSLLPGTSRLEIWSGPQARVGLWTVESGAHHISGLRFAAEQILEFLEGK